MLGFARAYFEEHRVQLTASGWGGLGKAVGLAKAVAPLRWCNALEVKGAMDQVYLEELGPKVVEVKVKEKVCDSLDPWEQQCADSA